MNRSCPALLVALVACGPEGAPEAAPEPEVTWAPPDGPGPWDVSARTEVVEDPRVGALTVEIWYPASLPAGAEPEPYPDVPWLPLAGVPRDAPPMAGPGEGFPIVLFSHGYGGTRLQSVFLTEHLASHGFVVVGVDHPLNTAFDLDEEATAVVALRRPVDLAVAADHALALADDGWLAGVARPERLGVLGHSFGAFTSLVTGGGLLDVEAGLATCAEQDLAGCAFVDGLDFEGAEIPSPDPRVVATMLLAPGGWYAFGADGLAGVSPVLTIGGRLDADLPYDEEILPTWERLGGERPFATLERAGHWGFTDLCAYVPAADCVGEADGYLDPLVVQAITKTLVTAFAGLHLAEDARYEPWIDGSGFVGDPEVSWEGGSGRGRW